MLFTIYDVGHGFCALAVAENGNVVLIDCGHKADPENRPSDFLLEADCSAIEYLFITNFDEDHISDLPRLRRTFPITVLTRNPSINRAQLRALKLQSGPISAAMAELLTMLAEYTDGSSARPPLPGIDYRFFWNEYPDFQDTNNLSLVIFLDVGDTRVCIPGDMELAGWRNLLTSEDFRAQLAGVDLFVASHHGRQNGYCPEVFAEGLCQPSLIVFSDSEVRHASQQMANTYANHASGVHINGAQRYVLTTRNDGTLSWQL